MRQFFSFGRSPIFVVACVVCSIAWADDRPNIVLLIADDISYDDLACYGNPDVRTPHIDALAKSGMRFDQAFLTASSCSPSRSSIITGRYPHNNGEASELHRAISSHLPSFAGILRDAGYHTALAGKHHMTWQEPKDGADKVPTPPFEKVYGAKGPGNSGGHANWNRAIAECPKDQPFFLWLASLDAHRNWDGDKEWDAEIYGSKYDPDGLTLPPALVDSRETRDDYAAYLLEVTRFDHFVGQVVEDLRQRELLENTYLFVLADNGRPFPRAKTRLIDDGMKTYLIASGPTVAVGTTSRSLVSVIDLAPTILQLADAPVSETMQGESMLPLLVDPNATIRPYAFSEHNWHDYEAHGRAVRDGRWVLIRNHRPQLALQGPADSVRSPSHQALLAAALSTQPLAPVQADVLMAPRPEIELYDSSADPHQVHNLADVDEYRLIRSRLESALRDWTEATGDTVPEVISQDGFDRSTGDSLKLGKNKHFRDPAGTERKADRINQSGL